MKESSVFDVCGPWVSKATGSPPASVPVCECVCVCVCVCAHKHHTY